MWTVIIPTRLESVKPGWINVMDRGIVGDGTTDVSSAIDNLIQEVYNSGGGTLYFPPGTYVVNNNITLKEGIYLVGRSALHTRFKSTSGSPKLYMNIKDLYMADISFENVIVEGHVYTVGRNADIIIERCRFTNGVGSLLRLFLDYGSSGGLCGCAIRDCVFSRDKNTQQYSLLYLEGYGIPVLVENCRFNTYNMYDATLDIIRVDGGLPTLKNVMFSASYGNQTVIRTYSSMKIDSVYAVLQQDTKTFLNIASSNARVVMRDIQISATNCTYTFASGYKNNIVNLDEYIWLARNPAGASVWLPTERSTTSTEYVTLKKFTTTLVGEIRVNVSYGNGYSEPAHYVQMRILKNGSVVREVGAYLNTVLRDVDILVSRDDVIEFQARTSEEGEPAYIYEVTGYYIPYRSGDFYDVVD